jgi:hypothetical protein
MAGYWLKLYTEILEDPKYYRLTDNAKLGMIELMLVAKKVGLEGEIPSIEDVAFYTRRSVDWWQPVFEELSKIEYLVISGSETIIRKFAERQAAVEVTERMKQSRALKHKNEFVSRECNEPVTNRNGDSDTETETETEKIQNREDLVNRAASPVNFSDSRPIIETNYVYVWITITGMSGIPASQSQKVIDAIDTLRPKFKDEKELIDYLKPYYDYWLTRKTKDGRAYSKSNCAWLYDLAIAGDPIPAAKAAPVVPAVMFRAPVVDCEKCHGAGWYKGEIDGKTRRVECDCVKVQKEVNA